MVTAIMLLSVFLVSGALAACPEESNLFITAPKQMEALSGSCLRIPCNFTAKSGMEFNGTRSTSGVWMKSGHNFVGNPHIVIFNSSWKDQIYPMTLTGDLSQKNCTTLFSNLTTKYTDEYFFRIENKPFMATATCDPVYITVKDSAPTPSIEISGDLKENQSVTITCSASTPCPHSPPKLTWNLQEDPHNTMEENSNRTFTTRIQKSFTLSDKDDGLSITCSASYPVQGEGIKIAEERTALNVSYAPKNTSVSISPSGLVPAGSRVNLTCSSRANPPISQFTWFKTSKDGSIPVSKGDFYSFNVASVTDIEVYYCVATNDLGNQSSRINNTESSTQWGPALGWIIAIILISLAVGVCCLVWWFKSKRQTPQVQSQRGDELTLQTPARETEEDIHYGEIDFSKRRPEPEPSSASEQDGGQQQDTLYAQVNVTANSSRQTTDVPEDLYAQVKRK